MILNSWTKIIEDLPQEYSETVPQIETDSRVKDSSAQKRNEFDDDRTAIISKFVDLSTSSDKLFEDISLKKIKKLASDRVEKEVIMFVLEKLGWNRSRAAKILKISYKTLLYKINEFEIFPPVK